MTASTSALTKILQCLSLGLLLLAAAPASAENSDWRGLVEGWLADFDAEQEQASLSLEGLVIEEESDRAASLLFEALQLSLLDDVVVRSGPGHLVLTSYDADLIAFGLTELATPLDVTLGKATEAVSLNLVLQRFTGLYDRKSRETLHLELVLGEAMPDPAGGMAVAGALSMDQGHPFGATGQLDLTLGQIAWVEVVLAANLELADAEEVARDLTASLQDLGQSRPGGQGQSDYLYELQLGSDGKTLVNGRPLQELLAR